MALTFMLWTIGKGNKIWMMNPSVKFRLNLDCRLDFMMTIAWIKFM